MAIKRNIVNQQLITVLAGAIAAVLSMGWAVSSHAAIVNQDFESYTITDHNPRSTDLFTDQAPKWRKSKSAIGKMIKDTTSANGTQVLQITASKAERARINTHTGSFDAVRGVVSTGIDVYLPTNSKRLQVYFYDSTRKTGFAVSLNPGQRFNVIGGHDVKDSAGHIVRPKAATWYRLRATLHLYQGAAAAKDAYDLTVTKLSDGSLVGTARGKRFASGRYPTQINAVYLYTAKGNVGVFDNVFYRQAPPKHVSTDRLLNISAPGALKIGFYPYAHMLQAKLDLAGLIHADDITNAVLTVRAAKGGPVLARGRFPLFQDKQSEMVLRLPQFPNGSYKALVQLKGKHISAQPITQTFVRHHFAWEHNTIGISHKVIPPFTPLKVKNMTVSAVLRKYKMNNQGLWSQVTASGKSILAGPIHFEVKTNGKTQTVQTSPVQLIETEPDQVIARSTWTAGPLHATLISNYDYDGMMKVTMHLSQKKDATVNQLDIVIPIKKNFSHLMHIINGARPRMTYSGKVPSGHGIVWQSEEAKTPKQPQARVPWTFVPYIWIGNALRGICWFADSPRGWLMDPKVSMQQIERQPDGTVALRIRLVTRPSALEHPRTIVFGLQATPTKPMPKKPVPWQRWTFRKKQIQIASDLLHLDILGSCYRWGGYTGFASVYPRGHDFSIYSILAKARQTGSYDAKAIGKWLAGYDEQATSVAKAKYTDEVQRGERQMAARPDVAIPYTNPRGVSYDAAFKTFQAAWCKDRFPSFQWSDDKSQGPMVTVTPVRSFQDYALWYYRKMLESGAFNGIYFDNTFLLAVRNLYGTWSDDQGRSWPSYNLFATRQLLKRAAVLTWNKSHGWFNIAHMTSTYIVPIETWAGMDLDWEWHYGTKDFQDRFSPAFIRTESIGRQTGSVPVALGGVTKAIASKTPAKRIAFVLRTQFAVTALNGIKIWARPWDGAAKLWQKIYDFGYGQSGCQSFYYWQKPFPAIITGTNVKMLVLSNNGKAMILVVSYGPSASCTLKLDTKALGLKPDGHFINVENGQTLKSTGPLSATFNLPRHDFRLLVYH